MSYKCQENDEETEKRLYDTLDEHAEENEETEKRDKDTEEVEKNEASEEPQLSQPTFARNVNRKQNRVTISGNIS